MPKPQEVKHIIEEGSLQHVVSYHGVRGKDGEIRQVQECSEPRCEINTRMESIPILRED